MTKEEFIEKMLEIGAGADRSASKAETQLWLNDANKLYDEYFGEINEHGITCHELSKLADEWANNINLVNIGIKTAFAEGYRNAEKRFSKRNKTKPNG